MYLFQTMWYARHKKLINIYLDKMDQGLRLFSKSNKKIFALLC